MIFSCIVQNLFLEDKYNLIIEKYVTWIGLFNWIPFFWIFWAAQGLLETKKDRNDFSLILIIGTIPVIISGLGQYFFNWTGPFTIFNGLIIWYQRPINEISGLTGLFNHANYAGTWLTLIFPLCIAQIYNSKKKFKFSFLLILILGIGTCIFLTNSRNAWGSSILTMPLLFGTSSLWWFLPITLFFSSLVLILKTNIQGKFQENIINILPNKVLLEFTNEGFNHLNTTRMEILHFASKIIISNPIFGTGSGSFPIIFELETGFWKGHSHNIFTELAISYGLPSTIIFIIFLIILLSNSFKNIYNYPLKDINDKAHWAAASIFLISQLVDVQYFDGRISIVFWLLLASLKTTINEKNLI
ncbi:MAG: O-antigen ligase family protein [Prochlorococcus marinus XMU1427]|nr:O-antigen ligase family protein [Prochlorococcus marinus]MCR8542616.1 O-antigen ligase family protein [Prochlorococcus marinus XMU1427]